MSGLRLAIKQPYFFPWIGFWQELYAVDKFVIYDDVNYIKRGWINRNRILFNREPRYFNLILSEASQNKLINEISIISTEKEIHRNCCILHDAYRKAPYYKDVYPIIEEILRCGEDNLACYLLIQIKTICDYLGINTELLMSSEIKKDNSLKAQDKILEICKILGADSYIDSMGATELYSKEVFKSNNINLFFWIRILKE